ncbi:ABC transporter ATP-binding protein [Natronorubrum aibiense]|uniref:Cobalamin import ATP-binding protein BtuD n=1 Tax=Natronorubrum aibiense TaxID=348826 RepID=A0A5P9P9Z0_9EURY|nr:ABC transporter ATP-binding protein [Natronorubrum aibiense]QFU84827.1 ATP-binding cassette domain-containing protein [Natronorubrum aibiense]
MGNDTTATRRTSGSRETGVAEPSDAVEGSGTSTLVGSELVLRYSSSDESVIDGESIVAEPGAVTALVGPNGSGKSTLLKGLANQLAPHDGSVLLCGDDVQTMNTKALARKLGLLSQESTSPSSITVEDLVLHGRYPHRGFFESITEADRRAVERAIELAGCDHLRERAVGSLSGGQKQLAWIAMVLAQDTDVLLLDEPTTFLDLHHQLRVLEVVDRLREEREVTVVVVLHDIEQAAWLADHMVALENGQIRARGTPEEVVTEALLGEVFRIDADVELTEHGPRIHPLRARYDAGSNTDSEAIHQTDSVEAE